MNIYHTTQQIINAYQLAARREIQHAEERMYGREQHNRSINGIIAKEHEITEAIEKERAKEHPDMVRLDRLLLIQNELRGTLSRCR